MNEDNNSGLEVFSASVAGDYIIDETTLNVLKPGFYVSKIDSDIEFTLEKTMTTPYFGEKYRVVSLLGIDVSEGGSWVTFYEDGRLEQNNEFSKESNSSIIEGFTYSNNVASKAGSSEFENMVISSNGVYITQYENDSILSTYILESEYIDKFSDVPLKFAELYVCTVDNDNPEENSIIGNTVKFYPDGSAIDSDSDVVPAGTFRYLKNEIFSTLSSGDQRLIVSEEGRTLTMMSGENVVYVYELSTNIPISWNTKDVMNNTSVVIDNSVINDLPQENPEFVKISDEYLLWLRMINCSIYADGVSDYLHFDYYEGDNNILVKYSNGTDNFYFIIINTVGDYLGTTFAEQGIYAYNVSGYDSNVNLDLKLEYTKK